LASPAGFEPALPP